MAQVVAVLYFGSDKVTVLIGERGVNNTVNVIGTGESRYAGFFGNQWCAQSFVEQAVCDAIEQAEKKSYGSRIQNIYVGVPSAFCRCVCRDAELSFAKKRRITADDVDALHEQGNIFKLADELELINSQSVHYTAENAHKIMQPVGLLSSHLAGTISYIFAEKSFISFVNEILLKRGITVEDYTSSTLASALFLLDEKIRDRWAVLIDVGYIATDVAIIRGDGIVSLRSFPLGDGIIADTLARTFTDNDFECALKLKESLKLSRDLSDEKYFVNVTREQTQEFPAKKVNEVAENGIQEIAATVAHCIDECKYDFPSNIPYFLTGGGISYIHGVRDLMSKYLQVPVKSVVPRYPQYSYRPDMSSSIGLLDMVLKDNERTQKKSGFFARVFGK